MRCSLWAVPVLVLAGCSSVDTYAMPVSGRVAPVTAATLPAVSWSVPPERPTVVDYDAEWKAFVRETLAVHAQKPEHPFWSAARTVPALSTPTTVAASTVPPTPPTLEELVANYFEPGDQAWALRVAFCESSATGRETYSAAINRSSGSAGWFQHLPKFWDERSVAAGFAGADLLDPEANVGVAAWLLYSTPGGKQHWYPSESCWR